MAGLTFSGAITMAGALAASGDGAVIVPPVTPPSTIGEAYGGGYYAGQISTAGNGTADYYLIVAPVESGQTASLAWQSPTSLTSGTDSVIDGPTNTANMNDSGHPAAQYCRGLNIGGYTDWYLPAINELEICYYNLKPKSGGTNANTTTTGINPNAVPARASVYTTTIPGQTSATLFQTLQAQAFTADYYWSSTQNSASIAQSKTFLTGALSNSSKTSLRLVRAIRRIAV
jgi:hypothetical protein